MESLRTGQLVPAALALGLLPAIAARAEPRTLSLERLATLEVYARSAEIVACAPAQRLLLATDGPGRALSVFAAPRLDPPDLQPLDFDPEREGIQGIAVGGEPTSVAVHPTQPAALVTVPDADSTRRGRVLFIDLRPDTRGRVLFSQAVGLHPDSVAVSPNGRWAVIANEGEGTPDGPGSVTVLDLDG